MQQSKDDDIVELRAKQRFLSAMVGNKRRGETFKTTVGVARHLIQIDAAEIITILQKPVGPSEQKPAGPGETKQPPAGPLRRLEGWPVNRYAVIERVWTEHRVVILGGGPTLVDGDALVRLKAGRDRDGRPLAIIAVNNAYQVAPQADVLYAADGRWWKWRQEDDAERLAAFRGCKVTTEAGVGEGDPGEDAYLLRCDPTAAFSRQPDTLAHNGNGGCQAINLAALAGGGVAAPMILLGFDLKHAGRKTNWHPPHPIKTPERWVRGWIPRFNELAAELAKDGVGVVNASEDTALECFPRVPIAELLPDPGGA